MDWLNDPKLASEYHRLIETTKNSRIHSRYDKKLAKAVKIMKTNKRRRSECPPISPRKMMLLYGLTPYLLFEFASGYALFHAHGLDDLPLSLYDKSYDDYVNRSHQNFTLKAFHLFSSTADALVEMNAVSNSTVTQQLKNFLLDNLPKQQIGEKSSFYVATSNALFSHRLSSATRMAARAGIMCFNVMRGLRMNIDKFIDGIEPKDLEKQQLNLARLYSRQRCTKTVVKSSKVISSSSSLQQRPVAPHCIQRCTSVVKSSNAKFVVVPHRFEGIFLAKGKGDFICTRNFVPGEGLFGEELIYIQNEDGIEVEYKIWNPLRSKLGAAILCGVKNMFVKPGSRVLYLGDEDVCESTVSHLSNLVGSDGIVYVVGLSDVVVNMVVKRPNVITIFEKPSYHWKYRMVVSMVDVIFTDILVYPHEVDWIANNARFYLRTGGHYMILTQAKNISSTSHGKDLFANSYRRREFNPIEVVLLEPIVREYVMAVGGFRVLEE